MSAEKRDSRIIKAPDTMRSKIKTTFCATCLSHDRKLFSVEGLNLDQLCAEIPFTDEDRVCWECKAVIRKFTDFRYKACKAQALMENMIRWKKCDTNLPSFSDLRAVDTSEHIVIGYEVDTDPIQPTDIQVSIDFPKREMDDELDTTDPLEYSSADPFVDLPKRQNIDFLGDSCQETDIASYNQTETLSQPSGHLQPKDTSTDGDLNESEWRTRGDLKKSELLPSKDITCSLDGEVDLLKDIPGDNAFSLASLLTKGTTGKALLQKSITEESLTPRERSFLVSLIVEAELNRQKNVTDTIRKEVWVKWATEISTLFKSESAQLYYMPHHKIGKKSFPASGLLHNRLITHRRILAPNKQSKRKDNDEEDKDGNHGSIEGKNKRIRPLPDTFEDASDESESKDSIDFTFSLDGGVDFKDILGDNPSSLGNLLTKGTKGKALLQKSVTGELLTPRERSFLVSLIVEAELNRQKNITDTIRKEVWVQWATEITTLFKSESAELYYMPYHTIDKKTFQASGLLQNRLITHRRILTPNKQKKRKYTDSHDSIEEKNKRLRPLPDTFEDASDESESKDAMDWLRGGSCPADRVLTKWEACFDLRTKLLKEITYKEYFNEFEVLRLPYGYSLLTADFERLYGGANERFDTNFPIIKSKLLQLLAHRGETSKADQTTQDLLELSSVGEEQSNLAALLAIVALLRQMPIIAIPKKKVWKLSREETRKGFLARVLTPGEIPKFCLQREAFNTSKGIPTQPYILAVGESWAKIKQYEIVVTPQIRYQVPSVCSAIKHTYNLYWALNCAYTKVAAQCWMFVQKAVFEMTSEYDVEGVPLRELLCQIKSTN